MNNDENTDEKVIIDEQDINGLSENIHSQEKLRRLSGILIGCLILMIVHIGYSIVKMYWDDSLPLVQCPTSFYLDKPTLLKKVSKPIIVDNMIKSFSMTYLMSMYPRTKADAKPFFKYVASHSEGFRKKRYEARVNDTEEVEKNIEMGRFAKFWIEDSEKILIRKIDGRNLAWKVSINGYLHKRSDGDFEKLQPRIELTVSAVEPTLDNAEGLVVEDLEGSQIKDPVSGNIIDLKL
jgi:hypothetical protein